MLEMTMPAKLAARQYAAKQWPLWFRRTAHTTTTALRFSPIGHSASAFQRLKLGSFTITAESFSKEWRGGLLSQGYSFE